MKENKSEKDALREYKKNSVRTNLRHLSNDGQYNMRLPDIGYLKEKLNGLLSKYIRNKIDENIKSGKLNEQQISSKIAEIESDIFKKNITHSKLISNPRNIALSFFSKISNIALINQYGIERALLLKAALSDETELVKVVKLLMGFNNKKETTLVNSVRNEILKLFGLPPEEMKQKYACVAEINLFTSRQASFEETLKKYINELLIKYLNYNTHIRDRDQFSMPENFENSSNNTTVAIIAQQDSFPANTGEEQEQEEEQEEEEEEEEKQEEKGETEFRPHKNG